MIELLSTTLTEDWKEQTLRVADEQEKKDSTLQVELQPSKFARFPSSQPSNPLTEMPSPHFATHFKEEFM